MDIEKIKLKELKEFQQSNRFSKFIDLPISSPRINSYINNPNASSEDIVLYLAIDKELLIGYKSIFADSFLNKKGRNKFGWLSGTWTHPNYRRQSVSLNLFNEAFKDWKGRLMYTNYAEESKAVYDKSNEFEILKSLKGFRYYIRFSLKELLPPKHSFFQKYKNTLGSIDNVLNFIFDFRFKFFKKRNSCYNVEKIDDWGDEITHFLSSFKNNELFSRNAKIYKWVNEYPWVKTDIKTKEESKNYYFSSYSDKFESNWYKVYCNKTNKITSVFLVVINDNQLKLPYIYSEDDDNAIIKETIFNLCITYRVNYFTLYDNEINMSISKNRFLKIWSKKFSQNYFSTKQLLLEYPEIKDLEIQSGDGDVVFV